MIEYQTAIVLALTIAVGFGAIGHEVGWARKARNRPHQPSPFSPDYKVASNDALVEFIEMLYKDKPGFLYEDLIQGIKEEGLDAECKSVGPMGMKAS